MTKFSRDEIQKYFKLSDERFNRSYHLAVAAFLVGIYGTESAHLEDKDALYGVADVIAGLEPYFTDPAEWQVALIIMVDLTTRVGVNAMMNFDAEALVAMYRAIVTANKLKPTFSDLEALRVEVAAYYAKADAAGGTNFLNNLIDRVPNPENRRTAIAEAIDRGELDEEGDTEF